jgi:hypothetical protein
LDKRGSGRWQIDGSLVIKVQIDGTERGAERTFRHVGIAIIHITGFLKRGGKMADCLEEPNLPCKKG